MAIPQEICKHPDHMRATEMATMTRGGRSYCTLCGFVFIQTKSGNEQPHEEHPVKKLTRPTPTPAKE